MKTSMSLAAAILMALCIFLIAADANETETIPDIEKEWVLKHSAIMEKSSDGLYQQILKRWENKDGIIGLTLSIVYRGSERYIVRAWEKETVVGSAAQPAIGRWLRVGMANHQFDQTLANMKQPTEIVNTPEGFRFSFRGLDGSTVEVYVILDPHFQIFPTHLIIQI